MRLQGVNLTAAPACLLLAQVESKVRTLKVEGTQAFAKKDYTKALECYERAAKLLPDGAADKVDLLSNKAACYMQQKKCVLPGAMRLLACSALPRMTYLLCCSFQCQIPQPVPLRNASACGSPAHSNLHAAALIPSLIFASYPTQARLQPSR